jgi:hypothetical protein
MSDEKYYDENFVEHLSKFQGETVTIYTTSGGLSGCGFTGIIITCSHCFVRLITCLGPAPCCAVGSNCESCCCPEFKGKNCHKNDIHTVGSVVDIPIDRIAAFVHNAV